MTTETYPGPPQFTVSGTGPYAVNHEYTSGALQVTVEAAGVATVLGAADFSVVPEAGDSGDIFLTEAAALAHAGAAMTITRATIIEQGWQGQGGNREAGLEAQLDRHAQALQEAQGLGARSLRLAAGTLQPIMMEDGRTLIWDAATGRVVPGPASDSILSAETLLAALTGITADATTLPAGSAATAVFNEATGLLSLGIPQGVKGDTGASGPGSGDLVAAQNLADLDDIPTARANLGLTAAATTSMRVITVGEIGNPDDFFATDPGRLTDRRTIANMVTNEIADLQWRRPAAQTATGVETALDFAGLPAGMNEIGLKLQNVRLSGSDHLLLQIEDSTGLIVTGYVNAASVENGRGSFPSTSGFPIFLGSSARGVTGTATLKRFSSGWHMTFAGMETALENLGVQSAGVLPATGDIVAIRLTRTGTNTLAAGVAELERRR